MSDKSTIEWTDSTWNPIRGVKGRWHCTKVSPGCANCYAERINQRLGGPAYTVGADQLRLDETVLTLAERWKRPRMIFVCSMTDLFHEDVPDEWIDSIFAVMALAQHHTFQILTKRPERMHEWLTGKCLAQDIANRMKSFGWPLPNVWLGVSVETQRFADERIKLLLRTPAAMRFVSAEPLLGPVDLHGPGFLTVNGCHTSKDGKSYDLLCDCGGRGSHKLDWVIVGGESGPGARPMHPDWARSIRDQCQAADVRYFFKQWGQWVPKSQTHLACPEKRWGTLTADGELFRMTTPWNGHDDDGIGGEAVMYGVGKKRAGRLLDGLEWNEIPESAARI